jgi:hypothetical protein
MRFLSLLLAAAALLGVGSVSQAADELPPLIVAPSGIYYVTVDSAGVPVLVRATKVSVVGSGGVPVPVPPDTPPQPPAVTQQVQGWAAEVNHPVGAQALAVVYSTVADSLKDGKIAPEDAFPAVKKATEQVLPLAGGAERWAGFRAKLGDLITLKLQKGAGSRGGLERIGRGSPGTQSRGRPEDHPTDSVRPANLRRRRQRIIPNLRQTWRSPNRKQFNASGT